MKIRVIIIFLFVSVYSINKANAQILQNKRHIKMIEFLLGQKALSSTGDSISSYEDFIYDYAILKVQRHLKVSTIYIFGSNSPHSKKYIALQDFTGLKLLQTKEMPTELLSILDFLKRNHIDNKQVFKCLPIIAGAYQYNTKMNFKPVLEN